jgi:hypothetical protein
MSHVQTALVVIFGALFFLYLLANLLLAFFVIGIGDSVIAACMGGEE